MNPFMIPFLLLTLSLLFYVAEMVEEQIDVFRAAVYVLAAAVSVVALP